MLGHIGDAANAILVAAAHNLRLILRVLMLWRVYIMTAITTAATGIAKSDTSSPSRYPKTSIA